MPPVRPIYGALALLISACSSSSSCELKGCDLEKFGITTGTGGGDGEAGEGEGTRGGHEASPIEVGYDPLRPMARSFVATLLPGQTCPAVPGPWVLQSAPPTPSKRVAELMSRYCAYRVEAGPTPNSMPTLDPTVVERAVADPLSVLPQASSPTAITSVDSTYYTEMRGFLGVEFLPGAMNVEPAARPYVAIVDTAGDAPVWPGAARQRHGWVMSGIVSAVRCASEVCDSKRQIHAQAFPSTLTASGSDDEARGSVWSLNVAVLEALAKWRSAPDGDAPLVLNLSVGWEPGPHALEFLAGSRGQLLAGTTGRPELTPAEEALFITLATASCQGVLTFAAAGNTRGGACEETDALAPASWEGINPLTWSECQGLLDEKDQERLGDQSTYDAERKNRLVYSVGGVDQYEQPIVNARPDSVPARVLYSAQASVPMGAGKYTPPLTGTSVATAAMSAIAAQYWAQPAHQKDPAPKIVADLHDDAKSIDPGCVNGSPVLIQSHETMSDLYQCLPSGPPATVAFNPPLGAPQATVALGHRAARDTRCTGREITTYSFTDATEPEGPGWAELTPQPNAPICPDCPLTISSTNSEIDLSLAPDFSIVSPTAVLELHLQNEEITVVDLNLDLGPSISQGCDFATSSPNGQGSSNLGVLTNCTLTSLSHYSDPSAPNDPSGTLARYVAGAGVRSARLSFYVAGTDPNQPPYQVLGNEIDVVFD